MTPACGDTSETGRAQLASPGWSMTVTLGKTGTVDGSERTATVVRVEPAPTAAKMPHT